MVVELAQSLAEVFDAGPDGENGGYDGRVDGVEGDDFQHNPAEQNHLGDGADLACPVGFDRHVVVQIVQNRYARNDNDIARDHQRGKPHRDVPAITPVDECKKYDACEQQGFVCKGIHERAELAALVKVAGNITVDAITYCRKNKNPDRPPADGFIWFSRLDALTIIHGEHGKNRSHEQPHHSYF